MEELHELIQIISKHKIKQIEVIGNENDANESKFQQLYDAINNDIVNSDAEAIEHLYTDAPDSTEAYNKLKNRLKKRLINSLFFIDVNQPQFTDIQKAFFTCNKNWIAIRTLISRGARNTAIKLAERTLRMAQKYEFTELIIYIAKELRFHYGVVYSNPKKRVFFSDIIENSFNDLKAELTAEQYFSEIMEQYARSLGSVKPEVVDKAHYYSQRLTNDYPDVKSFRFIRISYQLHVIACQISFQFNDAIVKCKEVIDIFHNKPYNSEAAVFGFDLRLLSCYVQLMEYEAGVELALNYSEKLPSGSYNWYVVQFYYFLLCTHSKQYQQSYNVLQTALTHERFPSFYENHKQLWYVNEAFVHFLVATNRVHPERSKFPNPRKFKLYKFLNEIPIYSKDKRGLNVSILIIHVLFLLHKRQYSKIIDRVDALNQYCHRYLRKDDTFRANCFIKMLLQMPKADFNRIRTQRYASPYLEKLKSVPLNVASQGIEVEIVPYEDLWDMVVELLN